MGDVVVARLALLAPVGLGAHPIGSLQKVEVEPVALQCDCPSQLGGEEGGGAGHLWRMAKRGRRVNAGVEKGSGCAVTDRPVREEPPRRPYNNPASAKLTYRSPPTITWSYTGTSNSRPASTSCRVTARSSADGVASPLGWLCTTMMPAAASAIAARNTSRGWTSELFRIPRVMSRSPST